MVFASHHRFVIPAKAERSQYRHPREGGAFRLARDSRRKTVLIICFLAFYPCASRDSHLGSRLRGNDVWQ